MLNSLFVGISGQVGSLAVITVATPFSESFGTPLYEI